MSEEYETAAQLVDAWDRGEIITSIEMGGIGPGYEQAIQLATIEVCRELQGVELPEEEEEKDIALVNLLFREALYRVEGRLNLGLSGAQAAAIINLSYRYLKAGHAATLQSARAQPIEQDRFIQVSNTWPGRLEAQH